MLPRSGESSTTLQRRTRSNDVPVRWLTLKESAAYLRMGYTTLLAEYIGWADKYGVVAHRMGSRVLLDRNKLDEMVEAHAINGVAA